MRLPTWLPTSGNKLGSTMSIGNRIKDLRGSLSQGEFANQLGVSKAAIGSYERGVSAPGSNFIVSICSYFNVCFEWLLLGTGPKHLTDTPRQTQEITTSCIRCIKLEEKLELIEEERRELSAENRKLWKENGELKERCATLEERQKTCCPELFSKKLGNDPPNNAQICA